MPARKAIKTSTNERYSKPLTRKKIANAAIGIVRSEGKSALSMRKIATLFTVDVAALYRHFRNKEELLAEIALIAAAEIILQTPTTGSWEQRFLGLAEQIRDRISHHPELGIYSGSSRSSPFFAKANGLVAELFYEVGLEDEQLVFATQTILHLITSITQSEIMTRETPKKDNRAFAKSIETNLPEQVRSVWPSSKPKHEWSIDFDKFFTYSIKSSLSALGQR